MRTFPVVSFHPVRTSPNPVRTSPCSPYPPIPVSPFFAFPALTALSPLFPPPLPLAPFAPLIFFNFAPASNLSSSAPSISSFSLPLPLPHPNPKPNIPWVFQIHIVARKISIVRYKTRHKKRQDGTRYQLHTKTHDMLLNNLDFKNPVVWLVRVKVRLGCI